MVDRQLIFCAKCIGPSGDTFHLTPKGGITSDRDKSAVFFSESGAKRFAESVNIARNYRIVVERY